MRVALIQLQTEGVFSILPIFEKIVLHQIEFLFLLFKILSFIVWSGGSRTNTETNISVHFSRKTLRQSIGRR